MKKQYFNKKGQFESYILFIVLIFVIGIIIFFSNHLIDKVYTSIDTNLASSPDLNDSTARTSIQNIQSAENEMWDFGFLAIFFGFLIQMIILAFATRIHIAFFWIYGIVGIIGLFLAVAVSNMWQKMVEHPEFIDTYARFPITNALLGTYFPTVVTAVLLIIIIVTFGKPSERSFA